MKRIKIPNPDNELLDVMLEGQGNFGTVIMVHGFGTDKHETQGLFDDIAKTLKVNYHIIRFDFSGYGKSQGQQVDVSYQKQSQDLTSIIDYAQTDSPHPLSLIAMSMGCYVTALLSPDGIEKTAMISIPDETTKTLKQAIQSRILEKGGEVDETDITKYPRSSGKDQIIGPAFWQGMDDLDPLKAVQQYSQKTQLLLIHPTDDEIVATKHVQAYKQINTANYIELPGNHSFTNRSNRNQLINKLQKFLKT